MILSRRSLASRLLALTAIGGVSALAWATLPPGVSRHDSGDMQAAAALLGIAHPPGYPLISIVGHFFSWLVPNNPALGVTAMNWLAGVAVLLLTTALLRRLGVRMSLCVVAVLAMASWPVFWGLWVAPEVYVPSLLALAGFVYCLPAWQRTGRASWLVSGALLLGCLVSCRISAVLYLAPSLLAVWQIHRRRAKRRVLKQSLGVAAMAGMAFIVPPALGVSYLWVRDVPGNPYNYISELADITEELPADQSDREAKITRLLWLVTARQYWDRMETGPRQMWHRFTRLIAETTTLGFLQVLPLIALAAFGVGAQRRRVRPDSPVAQASRLCRHRRDGGATRVLGRTLGSTPIALLLLGIAGIEAAFLCAYVVSDVASMSLPLVWVLTVLAACGLEWVMLRIAAEHGEKGRKAVLLASRILVLTACASTALLCDRRARSGPDPWAQGTELNVDWAAMPEGATICSDWMDFPPLAYAHRIIAGRDDLHVRVPGHSLWPVIAKRSSAPVYYTAPGAAPRGWTLRKEHGLWRVVPPNSFDDSK